MTAALTGLGCKPLAFRLSLIFVLKDSAARVTYSAVMEACVTSFLRMSPCD